MGRLHEDIPSIKTFRGANINGWVLVQGDLQSRTRPYLVVWGRSCSRQNMLSVPSEEKKLRTIIILYYY